MSATPCLHICSCSDRNSTRLSLLHPLCLISPQVVVTLREWGHQKAEKHTGVLSNCFIIMIAMFYQNWFTSHTHPPTHNVHTCTGSVRTEGFLSQWPPGCFRKCECKGFRFDFVRLSQPSVSCQEHKLLNMQIFLYVNHIVLDIVPPPAGGSHNLSDNNQDLHIVHYFILWHRFHIIFYTTYQII